MKDLKRVLASEFTREKATRTAQSQARVVTQGFVHGGTCPYGLRRTLVTLDGTHVSELPRAHRKIVSTHRVKSEEPATGRSGLPAPKSPFLEPPQFRVSLAQTLGDGTGEPFEDAPRQERIVLDLLVEYGAR